MKRRFAGITGGAVAAMAVAAIALAVMGPQGWAQVEAEPAPAAPAPGADVEDADVVVGTYDPQRVFNAYPGREALMQRMSELHGQMQQAQQQQDQQQMMQLQQQAQQLEIEAVEQFQADVEEVLPQIADEADIDLVAIQVVYTRDGVATQDISPQVIEGLGGEEPEAQQFMIPGAE